MQTLFKLELVCIDVRLGAWDTKYSLMMHAYSNIHNTVQYNSSLVMHVGLVFLGLSVLNLGPMYATDVRQTDVRRASSPNASALWGRGHNNLMTAILVTLLTYKQTDSIT